MLNSPVSPQHKGFGGTEGAAAGRANYKTPNADEGTTPIHATLVWHRIASNGFKPAAREGHSSVSTDGKVYIFGGVETGRRVNTTQVLDVPNGAWAAHAVGNQHLETEAEVVLDASSQDDVQIHVGVGVAADGSAASLAPPPGGGTSVASHSGTSVAKESTATSSSSNGNIPSPRSQHAACIVRHLQTADTAGASASPASCTTERQWMIVHGGEGVAPPPAASSSSSSSRPGGNGKTVGFSDKGISPGDSMQQMAHKTGGVRVATALEQRQHSSATIAESHGHGHKTSHSAAHAGHAGHAHAVGEAKALHQAKDPRDPLLTQQLATYEDLYALDLQSGRWLQLKTSLAPLPRRGHTMNVALVNTTVTKSSSDRDRDRGRHSPSPAATGSAASATYTSVSAIGFDAAPLSPGKTSLFGATHVQGEAAADRKRDRLKLLQMEKMAAALEPTSGDLNHGHSHHHWHDEKHAKKPPGSSSSSSSSGGSGKSTVVWRILQCKGTPPAPRYRHTATIVRTPGYTHSLVVIGGLGKGNVPLNDVHVLNLHTLTWSQLQKDPQCYGTATDYDHLGTSGPSSQLWPQPVYGHVAFACSSLGDVAVEPAEEEEHETFGPGIGGKAAGVMGGGGGRGNSKTRKGPPAQTESQIKMAQRTADIAARFSGKPIEVIPAYDAEWEERVVIYGGSGSSEVTPLQERAPPAAHGAHGGTNTGTGLLMGPNTGPTIAPGVVGAIIELPASSDESDSGDNEPHHGGRDVHLGGGGKGGKNPGSPNNANKKKKGRKGKNAANNLQSRAQASTARGPRHETFSLDLRNGTWKKLQGSLAYPSQRVNHCGATVEGWAPGNPARKAICVRSAGEEGTDGEGGLLSLPPAPMLGTLNGGNVNVIRSLNNQNNNNSSNKKGQQQHDENSPANINLRFNSRIRALAPGISSSHYINSIYFAAPLTLRCGIVWGGSSASMCAPDAWTLDLKWRVPGVEGFDENAKTRNAAFLQRDDKWSTHRTPGMDGTTGAGMTATNSVPELTLKLPPQLYKSESMPSGVSMGMGGGTMTSTGAFNTVDEKDFENSIARAFQKVKKERAHAEQLIARETQKNEWYKNQLEERVEEVAELKLSLKAARSVVAAPDEALQQEIRELKSQLTAAHDKERELLELNREAQDLLVLLGVQGLRDKLQRK